jgi:sRNA-binding carbon storage regulator CsrA
MALVLVMKEGDKVYIGDTPVQIVEVKNPMKFKVEVQKPSISQRYMVDDRRGVEILPKVVVSAGLNDRTYHNAGKGHSPDEVVKLVINAPREIQIDREALYLRKQRDANADQ